MKKIFFSIPSFLIPLFNEARIDLENRGYLVTNNFQIEESLPFSAETVSMVSHQISNADIVIAVGVQDPFVLFELGIALGASKKIIIMEREEYEIPSFLKDFYYLRWKDSMFLAEKIDHFITTQIRSSISPTIVREYHNLQELVIASTTSISILDNISAKDFEYLVFDFFNDKGYAPEMPTSKTDFGYDLLLFNYKGFEKTVVEIKKYSSNQRISITPIQQLLGAMLAYKGDHAIIVTSSGFTTSAISFAKKIDSKVELWDFEKLKNEVLY